jgi:hypothetical protein
MLLFFVELPSPLLGRKGDGRLAKVRLEVILEAGFLSAQEFLLSSWNHQPEQ